jgi:hypothetical protein
MWKKYKKALKAEWMPDRAESPERKAEERSLE